MQQHRHQKAGQYGTDGGSFSDYNAWSRVGGSAGGGAGYVDYEGGGDSQNLQPYRILNHLIKG